MAVISTLIDTFDSDTINDSKWTVYEDTGVNVDQSDGVITVIPANSASGSKYGYIYSATNYDLTASSAFVQIAESTSLSTTAESYFVLYNSSDATDYYQWLITNSTISAKYSLNGSVTTIKSVTVTVPEARTYKWFRIRESSGTTYFDYSADGTNWVLFTSVANPITITSLVAKIGGGTSGSVVNPGKIVFDNFNYTPTTTRDKKYICKVYTSANQFIADISNDIISEPNFTQEINLPSSEMRLKLARSVDDYDEGNTVNFDNIVKVYVKDNETTTYVRLFQGKIVSYNPVYGNNEGIEVVLFSLGEELDNIIYRVAGIADETQDTGTSEISFGGSTKIAQSFIPSLTTISYVKLYVSAPFSSLVTLTVCPDSGGLPSSTPVTNGTSSATVTSSTPEAINFQFTTALSVTAGSTYWLVATA